MELTKRSGTCTEEIFWECVRELDWDSDPDIFKMKRSCLLAWTPEFGASFRKIMQEKESQIGDRFAQFEETELSLSQRDKYYLGDDGFSDLCSHIVGLGKEVFLEEMEDPMKIFERACSNDYVENFSYGIPYEGHPDTTWDQWTKKNRIQLTEKDFEDFCRSEEPYVTFEEYTERWKRALVDYQMGDWAYLDPEHYVPMAKHYHARASAFASALDADRLSQEEECAVVFATLLMRYFGSVIEGDTEAALETSEGALQAWWGLYHLDRDLGALRKEHTELLPGGRHSYGGENFINDHRRYMGGLEGFGCEFHLKELRKSAI